MLTVESKQMELYSPEILLEQSIDRYGLTPSSFVSSRVQVLSRAVEIIETSQFTHNRVHSEADIELLAIADACVSGNISREVEQHLLGEMGIIPQGAIRTSTASETELYISPTSIEKIEAMKAEAFDKGASEEVADMLFDNSRGSLLAPIREKLRLRVENYFDVIVFNINSNTFAAAFSATGFVKYYRYRAKMFLPRDASKPVMSHEWIHTQLRSLRQGKHSAFYSGLNEAMTESNSLDPTSYENQRAVYDLLGSQIDSFEDIVTLSAQGYPQPNFELRKKLIDNYRLGGFLAVMRMTPSDNYEADPFYKPEQKRVFMKTDEVKEILKDMRSSAQFSFV